MARPRLADKPRNKSVKPEDDSQEIEDDSPTPEDRVARDEPAPSKAKMVRAARAGGMESPADGAAWIRSHYGVELTRPM